MIQKIIVIVYKDELIKLFSIEGLINQNVNDELNHFFILMYEIYILYGATIPVS